MNKPQQPRSAEPIKPPRRPLSAQAARALAEAAARKEVSSTPAAKEVNGRQGPDPVRYGDWEVNGIACDF